MKITVGDLRRLVREALGIPAAECRACGGGGEVAGEACAACSGTGEEIDPSAGGRPGIGRGPLPWGL
jgi:hypothetical protein